MKRNLSLVDIQVDKNELVQLREVLKSGWLTMGPKTIQFEEAFSKFIGAKYAVATSSCTSALQISLEQFELSEDDEVITTPFSWVSTTNAIIYAGAKPIFADIDKNTGNMSVESMLKCATEKTKGIVLVHYAGWPAEVEKISKIAKERKWFLVEDCAHALGSSEEGKMVGTYGDVGCFSFGSTKLITTGEGGMVVTNNNKIYEKIKILRNYGESTESFFKNKASKRLPNVEYLSYNYKINELASAIGIAQVEKLDGLIRQRKKILSLYYDMFPQVKNISPLYKNINEEISPLFLPVLVDQKLKRRRLAMMAYLEKKGIPSTIQYRLIFLHPAYKTYFANKLNCPIANDISERVISLPCNSTVNKQFIALLRNTLNKFE